VSTSDMVKLKMIEQGTTNISERQVMPISDLVTLRTAYVANAMARKALTVCREAQVAPQPRVYEKAYEAYRQALRAYNIEVDRVPLANYPRPDMNPLPRFAQVPTGTNTHL
jgi:hypothetical protein